MSVLEISMTQPAAKAGRNEKMSSGDAAASKSDAETSEADFEATYAADADGEANSTSEDAPKEKDAEKAIKSASDASASNDDPEIRPLNVEGEQELGADPLNGPDTKAQLDEASVLKARRSDTSELAFAQRVRAEQGDAQGTVGPKTAALVNAQDTQTKTTTTAEGAAKTLQGSAKADSVTAAPAGAVQASGQTGQAVPLPTEGTRASAAKASLSAVDQMPVEAEQVSLPRERSKREDEPRISTARDPGNAASQPTKAAPPPPSVVTPAQQAMPLTAQPDTPAVDLQLMPVSDIDAPSSWDPRSAAPATLAQTLARPETPGMIGRQMAEILQRFPDRPVELSLNPEELGRVRLSISAAESGITVQVLAERPETLDLMRRHIDQLAREFEALGYESINFAFNEGQSEQDQSDQTGHGSQAMTHAGTSEPEPTPHIPVTMTASTGVDIRV